jgi:hypothetical protein
VTTQLENVTEKPTSVNPTAARVVRKALKRRFGARVAEMHRKLDSISVNDLCSPNAVFTASELQGINRAISRSFHHSNQRSALRVHWHANVSVPSVANGIDRSIAGA